MGIDKIGGKVNLAILIMLNRVQYVRALRFWPRVSDAKALSVDVRREHHRSFFSVLRAGLFVSKGAMRGKKLLRRKSIIGGEKINCLLAEKKVSDLGIDRLLLVVFVSMHFIACDTAGNKSREQKEEVIPSSSTQLTPISEVDQLTIARNILNFHRQGRVDISLAITSAGGKELLEEITRRIGRKSRDVGVTPVFAKAWTLGYQSVLRDSQLFDASEYMEEPTIFFINPFLDISLITYWGPDGKLKNLELVRSEILTGEPPRAPNRPRRYFESRTGAQSIGGSLASQFVATFQELDRRYSREGEITQRVVSEDGEEISALQIVAKAAINVSLFAEDDYLSTSVNYFLNSLRLPSREGLEKFLGPMTDDQFQELKESEPTHRNYRLVHVSPLLAGAGEATIFLKSDAAPTRFVEVTFRENAAGLYKIALFENHDLIEILSNESTN